MGSFRFKQFEVLNERAPMKVNTDGVLLGAAATVRNGDTDILDIGTGTGVIALMLAQRSTGDTFITGIDIDEAASEEAADNFAASKWSRRLRALQCDLKNYSPCKPLDLIVSNPPYYDESLKNPDARESTARHTGSLSYRDILAFASKYLSDGGRVALIIPSDCEKNLLRTAAGYGLKAQRLLRISTTPSKPVSRLIAEFSPAAGVLSEETLTIRNSDGSYSDDYIRLTGDFYL